MAFSRNSMENVPCSLMDEFCGFKNETYQHYLQNQQTYIHFDYDYECVPPPIKTDPDIEIVQHDIKDILENKTISSNSNSSNSNSVDINETISPSAEREIELELNRTSSSSDQSLKDRSILNSDIDDNLLIEDHSENEQKTKPLKKKYKCSYCSDSFDTINLRKQHESNGHTGVKLHKCEHCDMYFATKYRKKVHEIRHGNDCPYVCSSCGTGFKSLYKQQVHKRTHSDQRPYRCQYCGEKFASQYRKNIHEIGHISDTPYECGYCDETFKTQYRCNQHELRHSSDKPYQCQFCHESFKSAHKRYIHILSHSGLSNPYQCPKCPDKSTASFRTLYKLRAHLAAVHRLKPSEMRELIQSPSHRDAFVLASSSSAVQSGRDPIETMASEVAFVEDFEDNDHEEVCDPNPKRKRQQNRVWIKREEFDSAEEAATSVILKKVWKKSSSKSTLDGLKVEYRCSLGKYRIEECPAGLYLLYHSTNTKVSLFTTDCGHDNHNTSPSRGLNQEMKKFINEKYEEGFHKPNAILALIRKKYMNEPPKSKLKTYLNKLRCAEYGTPTISGKEIIEWCKAREKTPDSKDDPFVLRYAICCESLDPEEQDIKIVLSTLRLLENLKNSNMVQIDATYNIIWQGYPVIIAGTSDRDQNFHPYVISICKGESARDFGFIFEALHKFDSEWKPQLLLSDASESITGGFINVFGEPKVRIMCFFHVLKDLEKFFRKFNKCLDLKQDIYALQTCKDEGTFLKAGSLFLEKWDKTDDRQIKEFIHYFKSQWLLKNSNWYEGIAVGYPSTNNGLEATNAVIIKEHTLRERLPVDQFFNNVLDLLIKWSKDRDPESPNCKEFHTFPPISLQNWTHAYQWAISNKKVLQENNEENCKLFYTCSNSTNKSITIEILSTYKAIDGQWKTFEDFKNYNYSVWIITIDFKDLNQSKCTCPHFLKHLHCKHVLGMKIRLKLVVVPNEAKLIPLGQKRKRGRPAKAKRALIVQ